MHRSSSLGRTPLLGLAALALASALLVTGCSQKYPAERDGKKAGEAVCDLRNATSPEQAQAARQDVLNQLQDLGNKYALYTAEDRKDIENNLADLAEHTIQGNTVLRQQDLAVLERSVRHIADDSNETARAAWEGFLEGLSTCTEQ